MEEYRARSYKTRILPEIDLHIKPGKNPEKMLFGEAF
jgi:hypothetical protein